MQGHNRGGFSRGGGFGRYNPYHAPGKRQVLGHHARQVPPAWRNMSAGPVHAGATGRELRDGGSRIFISKLPNDVSEKEVEDLFKQTVGPLKESFLVYNSQGNSKGMAVVTFQRPGDAAVARARYDGRVVDGRRPIKIEVMVDGVPAAAPPPPPARTLLNRITTSKFTVDPHVNGGVGPVLGVPATTPRPARALRVAPSAVDPAAVPPRRLKTKKGPKRLKKRAPVTVADLDKEMEEYRSSAPGLS